MRTGLVRWSLFALASALLVAASPPSARGETRTWTDSTGKYKIEAQFVEILEGKVRLKRPDGQIMSLPLAKLSKGDQTYLRDLMKGRRPAGESANPFEAGLESAPPRGAGSGARGGAARGGRGGDAPYQEGDRVEVHRGVHWLAGTVTHVPAGGNSVHVLLDGEDREETAFTDEFFLRPLQPGGEADLRAQALAASQQLDVENPLSRPDFSRMERIVVGGDRQGTFTPDAAATSATVDSRGRAISLQAGEGFVREAAGFDFAAPEVGVALVALKSAMGDDGPTNLEICDLKTGRSQSYPAPLKLDLAVLCPSGKRVATACKEEAFTHGPLRIWELTGGTLKPLAGWKATGGQRGRDQLKQLAWVDDQRLLVLDDNSLTLWNVADAAAIYRVSCERAESIALSANRKQCALVADGHAAVIDVQRGAALVRVELSGGGMERQAAFSPNGQSLAVTGAQQLETFDLATGKRIDLVYAPAASHRACVGWLGNEHVLVGGADLIHVPSRMAVWTYQHQAAAVACSAGLTWYAFAEMHGGDRALIPLALPHNQVRPVSDQELVLRPGDDVCLSLEVTVDLTDPSGQSVDVHDTLSKAIQAAGFHLVDDAAARLTARVGPGETREMRYRSFHDHFGEGDRVSVTDRVYELELSVNGDAVWKRRHVQTAPHMLQMQRDESTDQAIARVMQPQASYLAGRLPARVTSLDAAKRRTSQITINGLQ